jgi:hypothetical protein
MQAFSSPSGTPPQATRIRRGLFCSTCWLSSFSHSFKRSTNGDASVFGHDATIISASE